MFDDIEDDDIKKRFNKFMQEFQKILEQMMGEFDLENMDPEEIMKRINENFPKFKTPFGEDFMKNPFVMGFSVNVGPDGKPRIDRFGSKKTKPKDKAPSYNVREPLVDIIEDDKEITLICEMPGVEKQDIKLKTTRTNIEIRAGNSYLKKIAFPSEIIPQKARAKYKNGILEIKLLKK